MGVSHQIANMKSFALVLAFIASASYGGIVTGVDYGHGLVSGVGAIGNRAVYTHAPAVHSYAAFPAVHHGAYYGKREAEANAYTIGQVAAGLPIHNAYATGRAHNVGVITGVSHGYAHHGYAAYPAVHHGYYGKREAEADAYTLGQVAAGLPVHNAYATGHPHNVGVLTHVSTPLSYAHVGYTGYAAPYYG